MKIKQFIAKFYKIFATVFYKSDFEKYSLTDFIKSQIFTKIILFTETNICQLFAVISNFKSIKKY